MKLATCVVAVIGFVGTSAFAEDMTVEAPPAPPSERVFSWTGIFDGANDIGTSLGNVKTDFNAASASVTANAGNVTTSSFSMPNRVYPSGFMGDDHIGYTTSVIGGLAYGQVNWALRAGLNYKFH